MGGRKTWNSSRASSRLSLRGCSKLEIFVRVWKNKSELCVLQSLDIHEHFGGFFLASRLYYQVLSSVLTALLFLCTSAGPGAELPERARPAPQPSLNYRDV